MNVASRNGSRSGSQCCRRSKQTKTAKIESSFIPNGRFLASRVDNVGDEGGEVVQVGATTFGSDKVQPPAL